MADLETLGFARNDIAITVQVHVGIENSSRQRFAAARMLEAALIATMREMAPEADVGAGGGGQLDLAVASQKMKEMGHQGSGPHILERLLRSSERKRRDEDGSKGNIRLKKLSSKTLDVVLQRSWRVVDQTVSLRWAAAGLLLEVLVAKVPSGIKGKDILMNTTLGDLVAALNADAVINASVIKDMTKLMERALLWLHEQQAVTSGEGLTDFRTAMTIHLSSGRAGFTSKDFLALQDHYREAIQTHAAIAEAQIGNKLTLARRDGRLLIVDAHGNNVGHMAGTWRSPEGTRLVSGLVGAIVRWRTTDSGEAFQTFIKRDEWERSCRSSYSQEVPSDESMDQRIGRKIVCHMCGMACPASL